MSACTKSGVICEVGGYCRIQCGRLIDYSTILSNLYMAGVVGSFIKASVIVLQFTMQNNRLHLTSVEVNSYIYRQLIRWKHNVLIFFINIVDYKIK